jgi:hypothetical protein
MNLKRSEILRGLSRLLFERVPVGRVRRLLGQQSMALQLCQPIPCNATQQKNQKEAQVKITLILKDSDDGEYFRECVLYKVRRFRKSKNTIIPKHEVVTSVLGLLHFVVKQPKDRTNVNN